MSSRSLGTILCSIASMGAFALGCGSGASSSSTPDSARPGGAGGGNGGTSGTTDIMGTGGRTEAGGANGTTTGGTVGTAVPGTGGAAGATTSGTGGRMTSTGGSTGSGGASRTGGSTGMGGMPGTGGILVGGVGGTGTGGATGGGCAMPSTKGACSRDGDLSCGSTCCPSAFPYYCQSTNRCYPSPSDAASACGTSCLGCVAPVTGTCSAAPSGGACVQAGQVYCDGGICCASEYPYYCPAKNLCYASSNQAVADCGGAACLACAPTCSAPPNVTASEASDGICGGQPLAMIDGIAAYAMCDAALNSNVWSSTGADTAGVSEGPGWVETGVGRITGENGYQCVELAQRYFYFRFGICPWVWVDAKDMCTETLPPTVVTSSTPVHGDLMVITPGCDGAGLATGHVAVVDSVSGSLVSVVQENAGKNGTGTFHMSCATCFLHAVANKASP